MSKISKSIKDLEQHLKEQISFLTRSNEAYDNGFYDEAIRISIVIRVLLHETRNSKSLLNQLNLLNTLFFDSSLNSIQGQITRNYLVVTSLSGKFAPRFVIQDPPYHTPKWVSFDDWWNKIVLEDNRGNKYSRCDLILYLSDKEGGAHIDPKLDEQYYDLKHKGIGWYKFKENDKSPILGAESASCRQISFEIIETLKNAKVIT